jgi:hypothetical protein
LRDCDFEFQFEERGVLRIFACHRGPLVECSDYIHMASDGFTDVFDTDTTKKSSDLSAMAAEFPRVQVKGLQRRAGAKVGWDLLAAKSFLFSNHSSGGGMLLSTCL